LRGWGPHEQEIDPRGVDWSRVSEESFDFRVVQDSGPECALGRVKFMFPNRFNVYLHDTPARELFSETVRNFSHGCIRVEKPVDLAEYVLRGHPEWSRESILACIEDGAERTVRLPEPVPIQIAYFTAWVGEDGHVEFRDDIYGRDRAMAECLRE
jgi:murein L,D-transpeptidase YcbB/YkuD